MAISYAGPAERGRPSRIRADTKPSTKSADTAATAELRTLPEGWFVMHDVASPRHPQDVIPHVVIGPGGVFVIETKDWSGEITLEWGDELRQNGHRRDAVVAHAIEAGDAVANSAPHLAAADVHPVLCVSPEAHVQGRTTHLLACCADGLDSLLLSQPRTMTPRQVIQVVCELDSTLVSATGVGHAEERSLERETAERLPLLPTSAREAATAIMALAFFLLMITQPQLAVGWVGDLAGWVGGIVS